MLDLVASLQLPTGPPHHQTLSNWELTTMTTMTTISPINLIIRAAIKVVLSLDPKKMCQDNSQKSCQFAVNPNLVIVITFVFFVIIAGEDAERM